MNITIEKLKTNNKFPFKYKPIQQKNHLCVAH